jgi:hypothetical protein
MDTAQIKEEIEIILGATKEWDQGKDESRLFRTNMQMYVLHCILHRVLTIQQCQRDYIERG